MRPLKLTMTAFGPYKDTEVVDFRELGDHDLFVISGKTGSGKTTIFDGICFALYGNASGEDRGDTKMLRSDFADDDVHTAVELEFFLKGRHYRLRRQMGHVKKGNKSKTGDDISFVEVRGEEEIPCVDRPTVTEVNKKVEELVGLTYDQFKQIVMLPQGEFRKLLTSDTENKEAILRRLFQTENYKALNDVLKRKRDEAKLAYEKMLQMKQDEVKGIRSHLPPRKDSLLGQLLEIDCPNVNQIAAALEDEAEYYGGKIKEAETTYRKIGEAIQRKQKEYHAAEHLNKQFQELEKKKRNLEKLTERKEDFQKKEIRLSAAERADRLVFYEQQRRQLAEEKELATQREKEAQEHFEKAKRELSNAEETYKKEENRKPERERIAAELTEVEKMLPIVQGIEALQKEIAQLETNRKQVDEKVTETERKLESIEEKQEMLHEAIVTLDEKIETLSDTPTELMKLEEQEKAVEKFLHHEKETANLRREFSAIRDEYRQWKEEYEKKENFWLENQAVVLAGHLHDGEPCPVCGSLEHPNIATPIEQEVSREELLRVKEVLDEKEQQYKDASIRLQTSKSRLNEASKEVASFTDQDVEEFHKHLKEKKKQLERDVESYQDARKTRIAKRKAEEKIREEKNKLEPQLNELKEKNYQLDQKLETEKARLEERLKDIPDGLTDLNDLQNKIRSVAAMKKALEEAWGQAKHQLEKAKETYTKAEADASHMTKRLSEVSEKVLEAEKTFQEKLIEADFENETAYMEAKMDEQEKLALKEEIETFKHQLALLKEQTEQLAESLQNKEPVELDVLQQELDKLQNEYEDAFRTWNEAKDFQKHAVTKKEKIISIEEELAEKEKFVSVISDVHDMIRGQNAKRISFERFLQMEYLDQIIQAANERLQKLSNNQYYLLRSDRQESHGKQSGLALDVFDNHTGQTRDVKTLSGGEKFHASLSLALGMSDVVQSHQGSVEIETMFIDEGFGSLDYEAMEKAVDTLIELMESGRMIGVISHVRELKEVFPAVLEVTKTKEGHSRTAFHIK